MIISQRFESYLDKVYCFLVAISLNLLLVNIGAAAVVDVMLVYDTTATTWVNSNGGMAAFSQDTINRMNQAMTNSGLSSHSFRLVHSMSVNYTSTSTGGAPMSNDLSTLRSGAGAFVAVHSARETYNADLVAMLVDTGSAYGYVGIGYLLSSWNGSPNACFTVNSIRSVDISHTLTHEVGHNLGADHAKNQKLSPGPNTSLSQYSAGWYFTGTNTTKYHTIMAYNDDGYGNRYQSAPLFSTPLKNYQGTPAGHAANGDNTRLINQTMPIVAAYQDSGVTLGGITINGPTSINENTTAGYTATASWSDGSTTSISPSWSENSSYTTISSAGVLSASSVPSNQAVTVTASFTNGGITRTDTHNVTVMNVPVSLTGITISGPTSINENTTASYTATASWSDGTTSTVTPSWTENSAYTTISSTGVLSASSVPSNQAVTVTASFTSGGITRTDTHNVTVTNVPGSLTGIAINGPTSINENTTASYTATASWSDGTTSTVTPSWTENSPYATISSGGVLTASSVAADQSVTVTATFSSGGITRTDNLDVTIKNVNVTLSGITINGPSTLNENSTVSYTATATWSDGTTTSVSPSWSENSPYTTISSGGVLTASSVSDDRTVTISASFTRNGITEIDTHNVTVINMTATLESITISGPSRVNESSAASYTAIANWSDGSATTVTPRWSVDSPYTTINSEGVMKISSVSSDQIVTLTATFTSDGVTKTDTRNVAVLNVPTAQKMFPWSLCMPAIIGNN